MIQIEVPRRILNRFARVCPRVVEEDFVKVAEFFDAAVKLAVKIKGQSKGSYFLDLHYAS